MKITYTITEDDQQKYIMTDFGKKKFSLSKIIMTLVIIFFSLFGCIYFIVSEYFFGFFMFSIAILYFYLLRYHPRRIKKKYLNKLMSSGILGETKTVEVTPDGLKYESPSRTTIYKYASLSNISILDDSFVFIEFNSGDSLLIPTSAFSSNDEMVDFINTIKSNAKIL